MLGKDTGRLLEKRHLIWVSGKRMPSKFRGAKISYSSVEPLSEVLRSWLRLSNLTLTLTLEGR